MSVHTPRGLTLERWKTGLETFSDAKVRGDAMGRVVRDGSSSNSGSGVVIGDGASVKPEEAVAAVVQRYFKNKEFGFVELSQGEKAKATHTSAHGGGKGIFFHRSALQGIAVPKAGDGVVVTLATDRQGRVRCNTVKPRADALDDAASTIGPTVRLPCFSMNQPFAGLVAYGVKTLETRNSTVFSKLEGRKVLLHVGRRTYPDGGKHREILARGGFYGGGGESAEAYDPVMPLDGATLDRVVALPAAFSRGSVVAVLEMGGTVYEESLAARSSPAIQRRACATGADMGRYLTEVKSAQWLTRPIPMRGKPGVFDVEVPESVLPVTGGEKSSGTTLEEQE